MVGKLGAVIAMKENVKIFDNHFANSLHSENQKIFAHSHPAVTASSPSFFCLVLII